MTHPRHAFWKKAHHILLQSSPWTARCEALNALIADYDGGMALVEAGALPGCEMPNAVAAPLPPEEVGYRCFVKHWEAGEVTRIHGHPNRMVVHVMTAQLDCVNFERDGDGVRETSVTPLGPGEGMTGYADNDDYDNFIHQLRCVQPGWSLHIYSDTGARGVSFASTA